MKPKKHEVVNPLPYYHIGFECSNRAFYDVKNEVFSLIPEDDDEPFMENLMDYEGDLEGIKIYDKNFAKVVLKHYGIDEDIGDMYLVLDIW